MLGGKGENPNDKLLKGENLHGCSSIVYFSAYKSLEKINIKNLFLELVLGIFIIVYFSTSAFISLRTFIKVLPLNYSLITYKPLRAYNQL